MARTDVIPFSSSSEQIEAAIWSHLCTQIYLPTAFINKTNKISSAASYAPMYIFQASYMANWHASFGFDREEHYTEYQTNTVNGVSRTTPVTRTKTVTDWRPASGTARGEATFAAYAGNSMPGTAIDLMENLHLSNVVNTDPSTIAVPVEPFSLSVDQAWSSRVEGRLESEIYRSVTACGQGDRQRDWSWNASSEYSSSTLLFPIEIVSIKFNEKVYSFWVDGSDISRIKHDELPEDEDKNAAVGLGFLPFVVVLFAALVWWMVVGGSWSLVYFGLIIGGGAMIGGFINKHRIESKSLSALAQARRDLDAS